MDGVTQRITFSERRVKMKYKIRDGGFCAREILDKIQTSCEKNAFIEFIGYFGSSGRILQGTSMELRLLSVAKEKGWIRGLLDKGFIEEVKEETYKLGQLFDVSFDDPFIVGARDNRTYMLSAVPGFYAMLICVKGKYRGTYWKDPVTVKDFFKITHKEMCLISGGNIFLSRFIPQS